MNEKMEYKMKLGIITAHGLRNYGSVLQAFALKTILEKEFGHDVQIIDYIPHKVVSKSDGIAQMQRILRYGLIYAIKRKKRTKKFKAFRDKYFNLTQKYVGFEALKKGSLNFDGYICGSDQIWNPRLYGGLNEGYFLAFGNPTIRRIAYAPSIRIRTLEEADKERLADLLRNLDDISTRESSSALMLGKIIGRNVAHVVDPTLLFRKNQWEVFNNTQRQLPNSYGIVYETHQNYELEQAVSHLRKHRLFNISNNVDIIQYCSNYLADIGPEEFVSVIKGADFVITNSFHCMCFCLQFKTPFVVFSHSNDERFHSVLEPMGLGSLILDKAHEFDSKLFRVLKEKACEVDSYIEKRRAFSMKYLKKALSREKS